MATYGKTDVTRGRSLLTFGLPVLLLVGFMLLLVIQLFTAPPLWWDEGWTLSVARNWVETGHYGRYLADEPISPRLAAGPAVVLPVALSFRLFGVGAWQGRLPGVIYTALTLCLLYRLTARLYSQKAGMVVLLLALLTPMAPDLHPLLLGKQVLAEMPILCLLLAGYLLLFSGLEAHRIHRVAGAGLLLGVAAVTKLQVIPFLALSLAAMGGALLWQRKWRSLALCGLLLLAIVVGYRVWPQLPRLLGVVPPGARAAISNPPVMLSELLGVTAFVPTLPARLMTLIVTLLSGLPIVVSLAYAARHHLDSSPRGLQRLAIWSLASGWFAWYLILSVGAVRYLFPAAFLSLIFFAGLLRDVTDHFDPETLRALWRGSRPGRWRGLTRLQQVAALLLLLAVPTSLIVLATAYVKADDSVFYLAEYLRTQVPSDALIETYDSEFMFLTDQRYHYPPDQMSVLLMRRILLGDHSVEIDYDPLAAGPDYLIDGPVSKGWKLYPDDLLTQHFRLEGQFGPYELYARTTSPEAGVAIASDNLP